MTGIKFYKLSSGKTSTMFGISDIPKFLLAFFLVLPVISMLHEAGHVFFAWLMGAKNIRIVVGSGKPVFTSGILEIRQYYFWYGFCTFDNVKRKEKLANIIIFSGGALFNLMSTIAVILLVEHKILESGMLTYQFTYFSMYYVFFALLPMLYPGGNYSDGKIILELLKNRDEIIKEQTYSIRWDPECKTWDVLDHQNELMETFDNEEDALEKARNVAKENRPSRILRVMSDTEKEVQNYPRIPL